MPTSDYDITEREYHFLVMLRDCQPAGASTLSDIEQGIATVLRSFAPPLAKFGADFRLHITPAGLNAILEYEAKQARNLEEQRKAAKRQREDRYISRAALVFSVASLLWDVVESLFLSH